MELDKYINQGDELISNLNERLDERISKDQNKLLEKIIGEFIDKLEKGDDGRVLNTDYNRRLLLTIDKVFDEYQKYDSEKLLTLIVGGALEIFNFNSNYFSLMDGEARLRKLNPQVKDTLKYWLGIKGDKIEPNGYLDKLVKNDNARMMLKNSAMKIIIGQQGFDNAKKEIRLMISGDKKNLGALQKYHRNFTYDLFSQIDRAVGNQMGEYLGHNYAIYAGDIIKTSRTFCIERAGEVFHKSEIANFKLTEAEPPNYNPFTDLGGYGCRHQLRWISYAMARRLRPEITELFENK